MLQIRICYAADPHLLLCGSGSGIKKMSIWIRIQGGKDLRIRADLDPQHCIEDKITMENGLQLQIRSEPSDFAGSRSIKKLQILLLVF